MYSPALFERHIFTYIWFCMKLNKTNSSSNENSPLLLKASKNRVQKETIIKGFQLFSNMVHFVFSTTWLNNFCQSSTPHEKQFIIFIITILNLNYYLICFSCFAFNEVFKRHYVFYLSFNFPMPSLTMHYTAALKTHSQPILTF